MNLNTRDFIELIETRWHSKLTLVVVTGATLFIVAEFFSISGLNHSAAPEIIALVIVLALLPTLWYFTTRLPRSPQEKVGFVVALFAESREEYNQVSCDFVDKLRELLSDDSLKYRFSFAALPKYYAQQIKNADDARVFVQKTRARFFLYGKARVRNVQGKPRHVLNLHGLVVHSPIAEEEQKNFTAEFSTLLPPDNIFIGMENDLAGFDFTSEWVNVVARYIIGVAAYYSYDFEYARSLFESLWPERQKFPKDFPAMALIRKRLPVRLPEVYRILIHQLQLQWTKNWDPEIQEKVKPYLDRLQEIAPDDYFGHIVRAYWYFVACRDMRRAQAEIDACRGNRDATWRFSEAFLTAYRGDLVTAEHRYRDAFKRCRDGRLPLQIEDFIVRTLNQEPEKVQLHYFLGLINFLYKRDMESAMKDFQTFLDQTTSAQFAEQRKRALEYIGTIKGSLKGKR
jgi:hypothetical protein